MQNKVNRMLQVAELKKVIKERLLKAEIGFEITGIILFGSQAKKKKFDLKKDIDLLIVAEEIEPKYHRRNKQISTIKKELPDVAFDILLLKKDELITNFENHNPLFLDIAEDGEILYDKDDFLKSLLKKLKKYIKQRGLKRTKGGWVYPQKKGEKIFYLSKISNKDFSLAMLKDAKRDLEIGEKLIEEKFYDKAVYHFQQSAEKAIKAILIAIGIFEKTHFVAKLLRKAVFDREDLKKYKEVLLEMAELYAEMEPEVTRSRYPTVVGDELWLPFEEYEEEDAVVSAKKAKKIFSSAERFVKKWFE